MVPAQVPQPDVLVPEKSRFGRVVREVPGIGSSVHGPCLLWGGARDDVAPADVVSGSGGEDARCVRLADRGQLRIAQVRLRNAARRRRRVEPVAIHARQPVLNQFQGRGKQICVLQRPCPTVRDRLKRDERAEGEDGEDDQARLTDRVSVRSRVTCLTITVLR